VSSSLVDEITETDARDLSRWQDATFDAALIMGPPYHLPDESDRARAISEVLRVVRAGGIMFFALMPVFGFVRRTIAIPDERQHLLDAAFMRTLLDNGAFMNDVPGRFTQGWGVRPQDVASWFESFGLETVALAASKGLAAGMESVLADLRKSEPAVFDAAMDIVADTATEPALHGSTNHLLYVGRHL
jgi:SAM-dependent methyltransferase